MRQGFVRCAAIGIGVVVALMLAEGVLRLLHLAPADGVATVTEAEFRSIPGILAPDQDLVDARNSRLPYHMTSDSLGYRGHGFPRRKDAGEFRILFTGDSFVYGDFVADDETLPAQLERRLEGSCGDVRVVNAGLGDATIVDEAHLIERGLAISPDLIILLFSENDVDDLNRVSTWDRLAENRRAKSRFPLSLLYPALRRTALWNLSLYVRAMARARQHPVHIDWTTGGGQESTTPRLREAYRQALLAIRDTLTGRRIPLVFVAYPSHHAVLKQTMRGQMEWVTRTAAATTIPVVNLLTPLTASGLGAEGLYLLPYDGHPSPRGYAIAAACLAERLAALPPLANRCRSVSRRPHGASRVVGVAP